MRQANTAPSPSSSSRFAALTTAASAVTSLGAHWVGSRMMPSVGQLVCLTLAAAALAVIARVMPRRTTVFAALMVVGQLVMHAALSVGGGFGGVLDGGASTHGSMRPLDAMAGTTRPVGMLVAHVVGMVFAVVLVHLLLRLTTRARRAVMALLARCAPMPQRPALRRRPVWVQPFVPTRQWRFVAPLRGPPSGLGCA